MILANVQGKPAHKIFTKFPKTLDISVDILRDQEAMPAMLGIFARKNALKVYFFSWIGIMIFGYLFKKIFFSKRWPAFKRFSMSLLLSLTLSAFSLWLFYYIFTKEVGPTLAVIGRHF